MRFHRSMATSEYGRPLPAKAPGAGALQNAVAHSVHTGFGTRAVGSVDTPARTTARKRRFRSIAIVAGPQFCKLASVAYVPVPKPSVPLPIGRSRPASFCYFHLSCL